jgi:hypothetical protein
MEDEFNEWYSSRHVHEILRVPGYLSAHRFRVTRHRVGGATDSVPEPFQYLALYEVEAIPKRSSRVSRRRESPGGSRRARHSTRSSAAISTRRSATRS